MSKAPGITHNPFSPAPPGGAVGGLLAFKPPSPAKLKPKGAPTNLFPGGQAAHQIFPPPPAAGGLAMPFLAAGGGQAAPPMQMQTQMQMPAMQVMQAPIAPLQAAFHAAPVQTRHQKADVAKEHFKRGAQQIVTGFVTQVLPQAQGNPVQAGPQLLQQLSAFVQHHFQGVASRFANCAVTCVCSCSSRLRPQLRHRHLHFFCHHVPRAAELPAFNSLVTICTCTTSSSIFNSPSTPA